VSVITFASAKASPGATTAAALVAARWPTDRLLVECDESGGVFASRFGLGAVPGSLELAATTPLAPDELGRHVQRDWLDVPVLVAPGAPHQVQATFRELSAELAAVCTAARIDVLVDAGRLVPRSAAWPLIERSAVVVLVARPRLEEFAAVSARAQDLRAAGVRVALLTVLDGPYDADEFSQAADIDLLGTLHFEPAAIDELARGGTGRRLTRSALWQDASVVVEALQLRCSPAPSVEERI
jgi:hypothetical protein